MHALLVGIHFACKKNNFNLPVSYNSLSGLQYVNPLKIEKFTINMIFFRIYLFFHINNNKNLMKLDSST